MSLMLPYLTSWAADGIFNIAICDLKTCGRNLRRHIYFTSFRTTSGFKSIFIMADNFLPKSLTE